MAPGVLTDSWSPDAEVHDDKKEMKRPNTMITAHWPQRLDSPLAWDVAEQNDLDHVKYALKEEDMVEIKAALEHFKSLGLDGNEVTKETFPLPSLSETLRRLSHGVHKVRGFCSLEGLRRGEFTPEDNVIVFLGISSYIGEKRAKQDEEGNMLIHVTDLGKDSPNQNDRPVRYSNRASYFHTDQFCDTVALMSAGRAMLGGATLLAPSWTIYNQLRETRPDLIEVLAQPDWPVDKHGIAMEPESRPLLYYHNGRIILNYNRQALMSVDGSSRSAHLRNLSALQVEALDAIEGIARKCRLSFNMDSGDMLFINNNAMLHARQGFTDSVWSTRHLHRLWLRDPLMAWKLPLDMEKGNQMIYGLSRWEEKWDLVPPRKTTFTLSERLGQ